MDFFFYGTLLDADIRTLVLGPAAATLVLEPARLKGHRRLTHRRSTVPVLVPKPGSATDGLLAYGLGPAAVRRLVHYEGRGYRSSLCRVRGAGGRTVFARVFVAKNVRGVLQLPWRLAPWQRRHKRAYLRQAARWMARFQASA